MLSELNSELQHPEGSEPNRWSGAPGADRSSFLEKLRAAFAGLRAATALPAFKTDLSASPHGECPESARPSQVRDESLSSSLTSPAFPAEGVADEGHSPQRGESLLETLTRQRTFHP